MPPASGLLGLEPGVSALNTRGLLIAACVLLLGACQKGNVRPVGPPAASFIEVPVEVYVPIPESLTAPCPIARGKLSQIPVVSRDRKASLEKCNADKKAIREIQGKPVPAKKAGK